MSDERICVFCKYFYLDMADPGYSSLTPGSDMAMGCRKGVWSHKKYDDGLEEYRANLLRAETCSKFEDRGRTE